MKAASLAHPARAGRDATEPPHLNGGRGPSEARGGGSAQPFTPTGTVSPRCPCGVALLHTVKGCAGHQKPIATGFAPVLRRQDLQLAVRLQMFQGLAEDRK